MSKAPRVSADAAVGALLRPEAIALVGVSDDPKKMSGGPMRALARNPFKGATYPVSQNRDTVGGLKAYRTVEDIEGPVDVALVVVPRPSVEETIRACGRKGIKAAVVVTAGFAEVGEEGTELQKRLEAAAREAGVRIVGPNCTGYYTGAVNLPLGTSAAFNSGLYKKGTIALVTQSGGIGTTLLSLGAQRGYGPSMWFSTGNEMDLTAADFLAAAATDPGTRSIGMFLETIRDMPRFREAARAALEAGRPIAIVKVGSSEQGARSAFAHTGALAGSDQAFTGFCRQQGIIRLTTLDEIIPLGALFESPRKWGRGRIAVLSVSGGLTSYIADRFAEGGVTLADLAPETLSILGALSDLSNAGNPFDFSGAAIGNPELVRKAVKAILDDPNVDAIMVVVPFGVHLVKVVADIVAGLAPETEKLIAMVRWMPPDFGLEHFTGFAALGIPVFESMLEATSALAARSWYEAQRQRLLAKHEARPGRKRKAALDTRIKAYSETEARSVLAGFGLRGPEETIAHSADEAASAAGRLGYPVVLKILSRDVLHKTEAGGVILDLRSEEAVRTSYSELLASVRRAQPDAKIDGVLVQRMAPSGIEVIAGIKHEPGFGPVIVVGPGGVLTEAIGRVAVRPAPLSRTDAEQMIDECGLAPVLASARRGKPSDRPALVEALLNLSDFAAECGADVSELDINPLRVLPAGDGVVALDALLVTRSNTGEHT